MAAKNVGMIWPRSRSAMQGIGLLSGIWILVRNSQSCNWSSVCTRNGSIGTWSTGKPISMQQAITVAVSLPLLEFQCENQLVVCAPVQPQVDEGSSFSCGMSMCSNPIASRQQLLSEMGMAGSTFMCLFFVCRLHNMTFFCKHGPCLVDGVSTLSDANRSSCDAACTQPIAQQHYVTDHHQLISVTLVPTG
jgi:hypothetical protein